MKFMVVWKHDNWKLADTRLFDSRGQLIEAIDKYLVSGRKSYSVRVLDLKNNESWVEAL